MNPPVSIMWFRRDLRLDDLPALVAAASDGAGVVPLYVLDPSFRESGDVRLACRHDALRSLDESIREQGGPGLVIRSGSPHEVVPRVAAEVGASAVFVSRDFTPYGRRRDAAVKDRLDADGRALRGIGSPYAVMPGTVRKGDGDPYKVYTPFSKQWRSSGWDPPFEQDDTRWIAAPSEPLPERPEPTSDIPPMGEEAARDRWEAFITPGRANDRSDRSRAEAYDDLRDRPDLAGTSFMSVDLKWGTIHPRTLLADLDLSDAGSWTYAKELAWREFYADVLFVAPRTAWENLNRKFDSMPVDTGASARRRFETWCAGRTGFGIVDAGMRQLAATGWMHNRVRMITASFLVKDLHLPWQWGARWFLDHLVDGDLASNNHGWQWTAGTGTDASPYFRIFNPTVQQDRYDPDGAYVERWVDDPAEPMVDHRAEREEALRRLKSLA